jgi:hypothetical protein
MAASKWDPVFKRYSTDDSDNEKQPEDRIDDDVSLLLWKGAEVDQIDVDGRTALKSVCSRDEHNRDTKAVIIARKLIDAGATRIAPGAERHEVPEAAARHSLADIVGLLLEKRSTDNWKIGSFIHNPPVGQQANLPEMERLKIVWL